MRGVWAARTDSHRARKVPHGAKRYVSLGTEDVSPSGADRPNRRRLSDRGTGSSAGAPAKHGLLGTTGLTADPRGVLR